MDSSADDAITRRQMLAAMLAGAGGPYGLGPDPYAEPPDPDALPVPETGPARPPLVNQPPVPQGYEPPGGGILYRNGPSSDRGNMLAAALAGAPLGTQLAGPPPQGAHYAQLPGPPLLLAGGEGGATSAPPQSAQVAINAPVTPPAGNSAISVPGYDGTFTRDQANDAEGVPSKAEWDAAAAAPPPATRGSAGTSPASVAATSNTGQGVPQEDPTMIAYRAQHDSYVAAYKRAIAMAQQTAGTPASAVYLKTAEDNAKAANDVNMKAIEYGKPPQKAAPGEHIWNAQTGQYEVPIPESPYIKILSDDDKTQAEKDAGGEWTVNTKTGERAQVGATAGGTTLATAADVPEGVDYRGLQKDSSGKLEAIPGIENPQLTLYRAVKADNDARGLPTPPLNDFLMEKTVAGKGLPMTASGGAPDESLMGFDYLKQFPQNIQAAVMDKINGRSMPTGGRGGVATLEINNIASRVGRDIGEPMDDASFSERKKILTDLGSSSPASLGGQNKAADTALQHADAAADVLLRLHSSPGFGNTILARGVNYATSLAGNPNRQSDITALKSQLIGLGQEMTKMFAGSPGAEAERLDPLNQFPMYGTPEEQQAYIATQVNRIMARVNDNEYQTHKVLGPRLASMNPALSPHVQEIVSTSLPAKLGELHQRGAAGGLYGGTPEPAPAIGALPPTLVQQSPAAVVAPRNVAPDVTGAPPSRAGKTFNYVPGKGFVVPP